MGREVKRVPLGFQWPEGQIWNGYRNPYESEREECDECGGTGKTALGKALLLNWDGFAGSTFEPEQRGSVPIAPSHPTLQALAQRNVAWAQKQFGKSTLTVDEEAEMLAHLFNRSWSFHLNEDDITALIANGQLYQLTHDWVAEESSWKEKIPPYRPTAQEVNTRSLSETLTGPGSWIDGWAACKAEAHRLGLEAECPHCKGEGSLWPSSEVKQFAETWEPFEPPTGEGYQLWETVTEGSPISPVFETPEELAQYMCENPWGADEGTSYEKWLAFIKGPGWAPRLLVGPAGIQSGVEAVVESTT